MPDFISAKRIRHTFQQVIIIAEQHCCSASSTRQWRMAPSLYSWNDTDCKQLPLHGPAMHLPVIVSKIAPWLEQTRYCPRVTNTSLFLALSGTPICGQIFLYAYTCLLNLTTINSASSCSTKHASPFFSLPKLSLFPCLAKAST